MVALTPTAQQHVAELRVHYAGLERVQALENLLGAVEAAKAQIADNPFGGKPYPRPYRELESFGFYWLKARSYWIAYDLVPEKSIVGVFYETSDIPSRLAEQENT